MKILFDTEIFELQIFGGISLYFSKLFEEFAKDSNINFKVPYIYSDNHYVKDKPFQPPIKLYRNPFPFKKQVINTFCKLNEINLYKNIALNDFDIFHPTYFNSKFTDKLKKPYVLTVHDMTIEAVKEHFIFDKMLEHTIEVKKHLIENASGIIAISNNTKKDILKFCSVNESKIDTIYHGLPLEMPDEVEESENLPGKYILFIGQRAKYKNFANFLLAIKDILFEDRDLYLVIAGGGDTNKNERKFINNLGIENKVIRKPIQNIHQIINYYKNAQCFVFPSVYEGFGFPILEAFQCGCPVLCSNVSSFPEVAGDGAEYFDPYSENSMKNAVLNVLNNESRRQQLINKGYERLKLFSWEKTAELTREVYKKVLC